MIASALLQQLVEQARQETERRRSSVPLAHVERSAARYKPRDFASALRSSRLAVIAELKQRTPTMGVLTDYYRPARLARSFTTGGAAALSVLTHESGFGGSLDHLDAVRASTRLPVLRKDFITDRYQVVESRAHGADAVLLIVAALGSHRLGELLDACRDHGLTALVEVHDDREAEVAVEAGARVIGVNHRDLRTFEVDLRLTERLRPVIPGDRVLVSESGISGRADAQRLRAAGADAILVGELLMRSAHPEQAVRELATA